jgi:hypothetical protein
MAKKKRINSTLLLGIFLILLGILLLADRIFGVSIISFLWPLGVILVGVAYFIAMFVGGKSASGLAIPASIITMVGLILFVQNTFDLWATWSYAWALILVAVGIGLLILSSYKGTRPLRPVAGFLIGLGLVLFLVFGAFFELLLNISEGNNFTGILWAAGLIGLGVYMIFGRSLFRIRKPKPKAEPEIAFDDDGSVLEVEAQDVKEEDMNAIPAADEAWEPSEMEEALEGSFNKILHKGVGDIYLKQGEPCSLRIEASEGMRENIRIEVEDGQLSIYYDSDWTDWAGLKMLRKDEVKYYVTMPEIELLKAGGVGNVKADSISVKALKLDQSGAGNIKVKDLRVEELEVRLSGAGSIDLAGEAADQKISLSGAGSYRAKKLCSQQAVVRLSGVGSVTIWVEQTLSARISGIGSLKYKGSPKVDQRVSGIGKVSKIG